MMKQLMYSIYWMKLKANYLKLPKEILEKTMRQWHRYYLRHNQKLKVRCKKKMASMVLVVVSLN